MFCKNCGKELEDNWVNCPYCGSSTLNNKSESTIQGKIDLNGRKQTEKDVAIPAIREQIPHYAPGKIKYRNFGEYVVLSFVTCGIYEIYSLYGYVKDINEVCEGDGKESKDYITVFLLSMVTGGIYGLYWWYVQGERLHRAALKYGIKIRESGNSILFWLIPANIVMLGFGTFVARYIMFDNMNMIAKIYNRDISEEDLRKAEQPHPNLMQNVWAVYGIILVVSILVIAAALKSNSSKGLDEGTGELLEDTVNDYIVDTDSYGDSSEDTYIQENDVAKSIEAISGFITDINEDGLVIEESHQGKNTWITIDSYDFSHNEYHQCSNRNDLNDLENASIGDLVFAIRPLDKTQDTIALCFEILSYADNGSYLNSSNLEADINRTTGQIGFDWRGYYANQYSGRASMFMGINDDGSGLSVMITWPNGYNNSAVWELNAISNGNQALSYTGVKKIVYYREGGAINHEDIVSIDESGTFRQEINDSGYHVYWTDYEDSYNSNCDFLMVG